MECDRWSDLTRPRTSALSLGSQFSLGWLLDSLCTGVACRATAATAAGT